MDKKPSPARGPHPARGPDAGAPKSLRTGPSARSVARRVLARVAEDSGAYATLALHGELDRSGLSPRDRGLCVELCYGVLRQRLRLDRALNACADRGLARLDDTVRDALRLGAYQLLFTRVPPHAAVDDAVEAVKRLRGPGLAGFVNALLHRLVKQGEPPLPPEQNQDRNALSLRHSLPPWAVDDAQARFSPEEAAVYLAALNLPPPLWLRLNLQRGQGEALLTAARASLPGVTLHPSPRLPEAVRAEGPTFGGSGLGAGLFTVQDLGAQLVSHLLLAGEPPLPSGAALLDACAGVGGKSTHLATLTGDLVDVDAVDLSARKLELGQDLAHRLGLTRVHAKIADLTNAVQRDAALRPRYAAAVLDAPCSGLGVLRRHPEVRWRGRPQVAELAALQGRLLRAVAERVAPGGCLVYSVCTYTEEEGAQQVRAFLAERPEFTVAPPPPGDVRFAGLLDAEGALRTWPHRDQADGFYAVRLRRAAG